MPESTNPPGDGPPSQPEAQQSHPAPDAVGRGVLGHDPAGPPTLFVLAGHSLGSTAVGAEGSPEWHDLRRLVNLDAIGDDIDGATPVEAEFDGGSTIEALWPIDFRDRVIACLQDLLERGRMLPVGGAATAAATAPQAAAGGTPPEAPAAPAGGQPAGTTPPDAPPPPEVTPPVPPPLAAGADHPDAPLWASTDDRPLPGDGALPPGTDSGPTGRLTLEDVVYHGGYPGHTKKRKKCVAVMDATGFSLNGPSGPDVHLDWDVVNAVEAQNSDEAKFRLGLRTKRSSTVVVLDCEQGVTVVLEAKGVPTVPLKSALHELLDGCAVTVV